MGDLPAAVEIVNKLKQLYAEVRRAKGVFGLLRIVPLVVSEVETFSKEHGLKGLDKKNLAIETALLLIPLPRWLRRSLVVMLLDWGIERAVAQLNKLLKKPS